MWLVTALVTRCRARWRRHWNEKLGLANDPHPVILEGQRQDLAELARAVARAQGLTPVRSTRRARGHG